MWLIAAGLLSAAASLAHFAIIVGGPDWYRFFGAGEEMAHMAARGELEPVVITAAIGTILAIWAAYAFSAAGIIPRLPLLRTALVLITAIYMLRASVLIPMLVFAPQMVNTFWIVTSLVVLCYGVTYAVGTWLAWPTLYRPSPSASV